MSSVPKEKHRDVIDYRSLENIYYLHCDLLWLWIVGEKERQRQEVYAFLPVSLPHARQTIERDVIQRSAATPEIIKRIQVSFSYRVPFIKQHKTQCFIENVKDKDAIKHKTNKKPPSKIA